MKKIICTASMLLIIMSFLVSVSLGAVNIYNIDNKVSITRETLQDITPPLPISTEINDVGDNKLEIDYKLFGTIPVKRIECDIVDKKSVYLGGYPLGINIKSDGAVIGAIVGVVTDKGLINPFGNTDIRTGDTLTHIDGVHVASDSDIAAQIKSGDEVTVSYSRAGSSRSVRVRPAEDAVSREFKLGLILKNGILGIGTMTFIDADSGRFGALGHVIEGSGGDRFTAGSIYECNISGVVKGKRGKAGELSGNFNAAEQAIGGIDSNNDFGIYGAYDKDCSEMKLIELGNRYSAKSGKAQIYSTTEGGKPTAYDIEIIKCNPQMKKQTKGMVIRVTDKKLIDKTGGIVQGMSGSPIVQDGKLIGAVTHVFIGDPTKGYATYIDWMTQ